MPITPDVYQTLARHEVSDTVGPDVTQEMIAAQTGGFLERLAALTGHGVVPGVPPHPVFTVRFPTMQERAARREQRKQLAKGSDSGCTAPDQVAN